MIKHIKLYITAICLLPLFACTAQTGNKKTTYNIQAKADSLLAAHQLLGIFIGVLDNGNRDYYTSGFADPDKKLRFDSSTFFEIGSITKTFTAYVVEAVLKEKSISDTSFILSYLPDSVKANRNLAGIRFVQLLNHTSGLPRLPSNMKLFPNNKAPYDDYDANQLFDYLKSNMPTQAGKYSYSNLGAGLAGVLAERISGLTYSELLDKYIFFPFEIVTTPKAVSSAENNSQGYYDTDKQRYWNMNVLAPAGGLKCNGSEMLTYLKNVANPVNEEQAVIIETLLETTTVVNERVSVGRGWHILTDKELLKIFWHNGGTYGFSTFCAFLKGKNKAVIVAINQFGKNAVCDVLGMEIIKWMAVEN